MDLEAEQLDIVIVGAGICGLATALALHRLVKKTEFKTSDLNEIFNTCCIYFCSIQERIEEYCTRKI